MSDQRLISPAWSVNETLRRHPATVRVFNEFGIDACCGGAATITDAARRDGADADELLAALQRAVAASGLAASDSEAPHGTRATTDVLAAPAPVAPRSDPGVPMPDAGGR